MRPAFYSLVSRFVLSFWALPLAGLFAFIFSALRFKKDNRYTP